MTCRSGLPLRHESHSMNRIAFDFCVPTWRLRGVLYVERRQRGSQGLRSI